MNGYMLWLLDISKMVNLIRDFGDTDSVDSLSLYSNAGRHIQMVLHLSIFMSCLGQCPLWQASLGTRCQCSSQSELSRQRQASSPKSICGRTKKQIHEMGIQWLSDVKLNLNAIYLTEYQAFKVHPGNLHAAWRASKCDQFYKTFKVQSTCEIVSCVFGQFNWCTYLFIWNFQQWLQYSLHESQTL